MAKIPKFCPECGTEMGGKPVCEKCGFDTKVENKMSEKKSSSSNSTWDTLEPIVSIAGKWAWLYTLIAGVVYIISAIVVLVLLARWKALFPTLDPAIWYAGRGVGIAIWQFICAGILIAVSILWVRPKFSKPCGDKDWEALLTNVWVVGGIQIPWMLIMGVLLEIFGYGWGGAVVLIAALLIIFLGPRRYEWKVQ